MNKTVLGLHGNDRGHWVGDGFPVRSLFSYNGLGQQVSPFLLLDYGGPHVFEPTTQRRGVGEHPHRGFETVTIVYDGEVEHRDSAGHGGVIGPGDVQWMTAGGGIIHEEFHSAGFARTGGPFRMVQLWVNLPAKDKMTPGAYQGITADMIPVVELAGGKASARVIAGDLDGVRGPARTFTPVNVWDLRIESGTDLRLAVPEGHNTLLVVLGGHVTVFGDQPVGEAQVLRLSREGEEVLLHADGESKLLVLTGAPIDEPIVGYGPFVMNSQEEIVAAVEDFNNGRFAPAPA